MPAAIGSRRSRISRVIGRAIIGLGVAYVGAAPVRAETAPPAAAAVPAAPSIKAFQDAYATSFYGFDACGDQLAGRIFRKAITDKLARCNFPAATRTHFQEWSAAQRRMSSRAIAKLIDENGGLPVKLDGMTTTCREQRASPAYVAARDRLDRFARNEVSVDAVIPEGCDATSISP